MDIENDGRPGDAERPATGRDAQDAPTQDGAGKDRAADAPASGLPQRDASDAGETGGAPFPGAPEGTWAADATGPSASSPGWGPEHTDDTARQEAAGGVAADRIEKRRRPLFGTIVWGVILLAFSGVMAALSMPEVRGVLDVTSFVITVIAGVGVLLVVAGVAASLRRG